jgi:hypothetical protein
MNMPLQHDILLTYPEDLHFQFFTLNLDVTCLRLLQVNHGVLDLKTFWMSSQT